MRGKLQDKVCLISGSTGIAAASAELAVREGARIFLVSNSEDTCSLLAEKLRALGGDCKFLVADLAHSDSALDAASSCVRSFERIDALFNVAGISGRTLGDGPVHECTEEGWNRTMDSNLKSTFLLCRAVLKKMMAQNPADDGLRGSILNMASILAISPEPRFFSTHAYAASKGAILSLSEAMAAYYAPFKIRVNVLAPGLVRTPMSRRAQESAEIMDFMKTKQPLAEDLIEPAEIARAAIFLLSDDARSITGDVLTIDAGWHVT